MKKSSLLRYVMPLIGLILAIGSLRVTGTVERQPLNADPTVTIIEPCQYTARGFPLKVTEQAISLDGKDCPAGQTLAPANMMFNWILYSTVLLLLSVIIHPPVWMKRNETVKIAGYSASLVGLALVGIFGWGMPVVLIGF